MKLIGVGMQRLKPRSWVGYGGIEHVARVLGCDPKTIQRGIEELEGEDVLDPLRIRKKGVDARP